MPRQARHTGESLGSWRSVQTLLGLQQEPELGKQIRDFRLNDVSDNVLVDTKVRMGHPVASRDDTLPLDLLMRVAHVLGDMRCRLPYELEVAQRRVVGSQVSDETFLVHSVCLRQHPLGEGDHVLNK